MATIIELPHRSAKHDSKQNTPTLFEKAHLLRYHVVRPALGIVDAHSRHMENLIVGAGLDNDEPLLGMNLCNVSESSYLNAISSLKRKVRFKDQILAACYMDVFPQYEALAWNARLACYVSLIIFGSAPNPPPLYNSPQELHSYYMKHFPRMIEGTPGRALQAFNAAVETM